MHHDSIFWPSRFYGISINKQLQIHEMEYLFFQQTIGLNMPVVCLLKNYKLVLP